MNVEEAESEVRVKERPEGKDVVVVAESVAEVETTESVVEEMVVSADAEIGSADDIAVSVADSDDEAMAVVVPASVIVALG